MSASLFRAKFLGSTTVGERGQIVIPAEARKEYGLESGDKVLVFGRPGRMGLLLVKDEVIAGYVDQTMAQLSDLEKLLARPPKDSKAHAPSPGRSKSPRNPKPRG
ncbi:MAG TPA: AbrB/MazE/SpoVT family DNA-binding domain-containing protein [Bacillota bacterium]|jgi:AbrB family looped-hinge helix DNA binding protein